MGVRDRLAQLATLRTKTVEIEGEKFTVQESSAATFAEYGRLNKEDRTAAVALLIRDCVLVPEGEPPIDDKTARAIAASARLAMPIVSAVMDVNGFSDKEDPQKEPIPG